MKRDPSTRGSFAVYSGDPAPVRTIEDAWDVLGGARTDNTLARLIAKDKAHERSYFVNDNYFWKYTDAQCNFHATYGWRPFFNPLFRHIDYDTWNRFFECQVDADLREWFTKQTKLGKSPPIGFMPHSVYPEKEVYESLPFFYCNCFKPGDEAHERHDEEIDFQLLNVLSAADWALFERDMNVSRRILGQVEIFMRALEERLDKDGLLLVGPQGSQIEFAHGGWRYPSSTFVYLLSVCRRMIEVAGMIEGSDGGRSIKKWERREERLAQHLGRFLQRGKWFVGALDRSRKEQLGTGLLDSTASCYFESYPNLNAIILQAAGPRLAETILDRFAEIPQMTENTLVLINYPERPLTEMDGDHEGFPSPGVHVNGGSWWTLASSMICASAALGRPGAIGYVEDLLQFLRDHLTLDYYNDWGRDPKSQWSDKGNGAKDHFSMGAAGAFGMLFRGMLGTMPLRDGIRMTPRLPSGITGLKMLAPVHYGGKQLYFDIRDAGKSGTGGRSETPERFIPYTAVEDKQAVTIEV